MQQDKLGKDKGSQKGMPVTIRSLAFDRAIDTLTRIFILLVAIIALSAPAIGTTFAGRAGLMGGALGAGVVALLAGITAIVMRRGALDLTMAPTWAGAGSLVKVVLVFIVLAVSRYSGVVNMFVLAVTVVLGVIVVVGAEMWVLAKARIPIIDDPQEV